MTKFIALIAVTLVLVLGSVSALKAHEQKHWHSGTYDSHHHWVDGYWHYDYHSHYEPKPKPTQKVELKIDNDVLPFLFLFGLLNAANNQ